MRGNQRNRGRGSGKRTADHRDNEQIVEDEDDRQINRDNPVNSNNNIDNNDNNDGNDLSLVSLLFIDKKLGFACYKVPIINTISIIISIREL